ncbi:hypothetical protein DPMN_136078 [Dreissena polymorpha]|uniref:C-type lectin domain-containing protein n=1 Tax=Dreissena polymorpha TaxID=45954 RepID=A0A9D4FZ57_DREPO|nr:hypothetical protein DPMN_136078 [Dreissena polymorpha]
MTESLYCLCRKGYNMYIPDLAPMDFRVFPEVKSQLRGIRFASKQKLTVAAKRIVSSFDADWYRDTFDKWISRHIKCICVGESHLVHVETAAENNFLKEQMHRLSAQYWWVGITDEGVDGKWRLYPTDEDITFSDFQSGDAEDSLAEDCAEFAPVYHFAWADVECSASNSPVCETIGFFPPCDVNASAALLTPAQQFDDW